MMTVTTERAILLKRGAGGAGEVSHR
jgi:hypothetical protein